MLNLVSKKSDKVFDDTLEDLGGYTLFRLSKYKYASEYPFLKQATDVVWAELAKRYYVLDNNRQQIYIRFVDPTHPRFGSIARLDTYHSNSWYGNRYTTNDATRLIDSFCQGQVVSGDCRWDSRNSNPWIYSSSDLIEFLPDHSGPTVWQYDKERSQRVAPVEAKDRLGRVIQVGDFCAYILYQFTGPSSAGIYFGNVTRVDPDGQVFLKNVSLEKGEPSQEKAVKDNSLVTILTDDLMNQLMLAKLRT